MSFPLVGDQSMIFQGSNKMQLADKGLPLDSGILLAWPGGLHLQLDRTQTITASCFLVGLKRESNSFNCHLRKRLQMAGSVPKATLGDFGSLGWS
jgi:hypothetical protein